MTPTERPPTLDPIAVSRWERSAPLASPWLHEEVARRMMDRLQWIKLQPQAWVHWARCAAGCRPMRNWPKPTRARRPSCWKTARGASRRP